MLTPGTVLQGRYKIERMLGQGGMSTVYLAEHLRLGRKLALKALQPVDFRQQQAHFEQLEYEARIMAGLTHPNLALVMDFFFEERQPYLVMEFIEGRDLQQIAELAPKPLSQRRVLEFAVQLLDVLEYLHSLQPPVIVRDLKPSNVMMDGHQHLRLIDFGLAKTLGPGQGTRPLVKGMGSPGYAPIEQYGLTNTTDVRSDIYALGATLLFLLTDLAPPQAAQRAADKTPLLDPRTVNPSVTEEVWKALQFMLELEARNRPASVVEVRKLLGLGVPPSLPPPLPAPLPPPASAPAPKPGVRNCPVCGQPLQRDQKQRVEVDFCPTCQGLWLDRGELEQLLEVSQVYPATPADATKKRTLWEYMLDLVVTKE